MKYLSAKDHTGRPQLPQAETLEGLVEEMRVTTFLPTESVGEFMKGIVERCTMWNGAVIRLDTAEHFLKDLEAEGLVTFEVAH